MRQMAITIRTRLAAGALIVVAAIAGLAALLASSAGSQPRERLGLVTSLPIYWNETIGGDMLAANEDEPHWVRTVLERQFELVPLDGLAASDEVAPSAEFARLGKLILAQPRALQPAEFVALDSWLRNGGVALIFADPLLTQHSNYSLGDPRRPQAAALLSPILKRWGLEQQYIAEQPGTTRLVDMGGFSMPVQQAGLFKLVPGGGATCEISGGGLMADCTIGQGRAVIIGDAAMLDANGDLPEQSAALRALLSSTFGAS